MEANHTPGSAKGTAQHRVSPDPPESTADAVVMDAGELAGWSRWLAADDRTPLEELEETESDLDPASAAESRHRSVEDPLAALVAQLGGRPVRHRVLRSRTVLVVGTATAIVVLAFAAVMAALGNSESPSKATDPLPTLIPAVDPSSTTVSSASPAWCPVANTGARVVGAGPGDLTTAPGVILAQQYALYVARDADAARAVLAPDALAAPVQATRDAITAIPAGTQHCVTVLALAPGRFDVRIDERHPDNTVVTWQQVVTTSEHEGRVLITSITAGGN